MPAPAGVELRCHVNYSCHISNGPGRHSGGVRQLGEFLFAASGRALPSLDIRIRKQPGEMLLRDEGWEMLRKGVLSGAHIRKREVFEHSCPAASTQRAIRTFKPHDRSGPT